MVSEADAAAIFKRNRLLRYVTWNLPSDKKRRLPVPTFVLLRKDGTVAGKTVGDEPDRTIGFPTATNLARLDEMLELCKDTTENANGEPATTALQIGLVGFGSNSLQNADMLDVWKMPEGSAGGHLKAMMTAPVPTPVTLSLKEIGEGITNEIASVSGDAMGLSLTATLQGKGVPYLYVQGDSSSSAFAATNASSTIRPYALKTYLTIAPQDQAQSMALGAGTVSVEVALNELYEFSVSAGTFTPDSSFVAEGNFFRALKTGISVVTLSDAAVLTYRLWRPGKIAFAQASQTVAESAGHVTVTVVRSEGSSGSCTVSVRLDPSASTAVNGSCYTWADTDLTWADGETGCKTVSFSLEGGDSYEGRRSIVLYLAASACAAAVDTSMTHTVILRSSSHPMLSSDAYTVELFKGIHADWEEPVCNIPENGDVTVKKESGRLPAGIRAKYNASNMTFQLTGIPKAAGTYTVVYSLAGQRAGGKSAGEPSTFTLIVKDPASYNAFAGSAWRIRNLPLFATVQGTNILAGVLTVKASINGRITAVYAEGKRGTILMKGKWTSFDTATSGSRHRNAQYRLQSKAILDGK